MSLMTKSGGDSNPNVFSSIRRFSADTSLSNRFSVLGNSTNGDSLGEPSGGVSGRSRFKLESHTLPVRRGWSPWSLGGRRIEAFNWFPEGDEMKPRLVRSLKPTSSSASSPLTTCVGRCTRRLRTSLVFRLVSVSKARAIIVLASDETAAAPALFGGILLAYVMYDVTHCYLHHGKPSTVVPRKLKTQTA